MVQNRWMEIAEAVWDEYVVDVAENGYGTEMIWDRQVKNFWEKNLVAAPDISSMNSRKNWRIIGHFGEVPVYQFAVMVMGSGQQVLCG